MAADIGSIEEVHLLGGVSHRKLGENALTCFLTPNVWQDL